jgi:hypothetical protein
MCLLQGLLRPCKRWVRVYHKNKTALIMLDDERIRIGARSEDGCDADADKQQNGDKGE